MTRQELLTRKQELTNKLRDVEKLLDEDAIATKTITLSQFEKLSGKESTAFLKSGGKVIEG